MTIPRQFRAVIRVPISQRSEEDEEAWWAAVAEERGFASLREFDQFCRNLPPDEPEEVFQHEPD